MIRKYITQNFFVYCIRILWNVEVISFPSHTLRYCKCYASVKGTLSANHPFVKMLVDIIVAFSPNCTQNALHTCIICKYFTLRLFHSKKQCIFYTITCYTAVIYPDNYHSDNFVRKISFVRYLWKSEHWKKILEYLKFTCLNSSNYSYGKMRCVIILS